MKIGMIFECGPDGADKKVCEYFAHQLMPNIEISSITLDTKPNLVTDCGEVTAILLSEGCERVLIIWDLFPSWSKDRPCRKKDREQIYTSLKQADAYSPNVYLICIRAELEAWLIADGQALSKVIYDYYTHPHQIKKVKDVKNPETVSNPKKRLAQILKQNTKGGIIYNDRVHAKIIAEALDWTKLKKYSPSFARFVTKLTDK